jgi:hypothetical protein
VRSRTDERQRSGNSEPDREQLGTSNKQFTLAAEPAMKRLLSNSERKVLDSFREYQIQPGEMLCFHGQTLLQFEKPLHTLIDKQLILEERVKGAYCLTRAGFAAMNVDRAARREKLGK